MPITIRWFNAEHTIIQYEFEGRWSWEELHAAIEQVQALMNSVDHRVDIIVDVSGSRGIPAGAITQMRGGTLKASENWGMGVFVGTGAFIKALLNTFSRVYPQMGERYATADTPEAAHQIILEARKSLE